MLAKTLSIFDNIMLMGDFNINFKNKQDSSVEKLNNFYDTFSLTNLAGDHTCFTKVHKSSIDLVLTNQKSSFQLTQATKTGITSDIHLLRSTFIKS